ncbi:hypothetical protein QJ856_gp0833 [Tupanvirus deep ocean]|uniref:Uncharacterized protein n=2 Tax=Tupanvirus TaxID=2094720 RepID=A0AC62A819_9VIRU|nr:hypothetical protein QJ856_gp0833 [Tupanvirus deep ocean]QKU33922.1 hypothetical protein [Tupanvirus deep ocean]
MDITANVDKNTDNKNVEIFEDINSTNTDINLVNTVNNIFNVDNNVTNVYPTNVDINNTVPNIDTNDDINNSVVNTNTPTVNINTIIIDNPPKKMLYVNCLNIMTIDWPAIKLETFMEKHIKKNFDIVSIFDIGKMDLSVYELVIINATCLTSVITKMSDNLLFNKLCLLKNIKNIVILLHDLHDYSFSFAYNSKIIRKNRNSSIYGKKIPVLSVTLSKKIFKRFLENFNIKSLISIYDCPEFDYFNGYLTNIKNFYLINHGYSKDIFKPCSRSKKYDVLFYGCNNSVVYPLRTRLANLFRKSNIRFRTIDARENIYEKDLEEIINESWMCIACVSNYSYFVRKYLEISACNSIVIGDINNQGYRIIGTNMVFVDRKMSDQEILNKVNFYLTNKEIISALSFNKLKYIEKEDYESHAEKLANICESIINNNNNQYIFKKNTANPEYHKIMHDKKLIDIKFNIECKDVLSNISLNKGLYVFKITSRQINNFYVCDSDKKQLTRKETYVYDDDNKNTHYVSFYVDNETKISIPNTYVNNQFELYNIFSK